LSTCPHINYSTVPNANSPFFGTFTKTFYAQGIYHHRELCAAHAKGIQPATETTNFLEPDDDGNKQPWT
jgi:hypothetical protein